MAVSLVRSDAAPERPEGTGPPTPGTTAWLTIDRPTRLNALDLTAIAELGNAVAALEKHPVARVVLASTGRRAFVAGGDLKAFAAIDTRGAATEMSTAMSDVLARLEQLPSLVIAAVDGFAYGGGVETLLACDLVYVSPHARLGLTQARFALLPGWGGATRLAERVGRRQAFRLLATGAVLHARDAVRLGLADAVVADPLRAASQIGLPCPSNDFLGRLRTALAPEPRRDDRLTAEHEVFVDSWMTDEHFARVDQFLGGSDEG